jgi:hypothetical protein
VPTDEQRRQVMVMRSDGLALPVIAKVLGVSNHTLRKGCGQELKHGHETVMAHISAALVRAALSGNVFAQRYWLATHGGPEWRIPREAWAGSAPDDATEVVHFISLAELRAKDDPAKG